MIGTVFLWIMWPSFNAATAETDEQQVRAIVNTFLSICVSSFTAFVVSRLSSPEIQFNVIHIQNSTLAGGVVMGVAAHLDLQPAGAMGAGMVAGAVSVLGFQYVSPILTNVFNIQDTCGVHNLHGMPGILSALVGIFATLRLSHDAPNVEPVLPRGDDQAGHQAAAMFISLGLGIGGGIVTGYLIKLVERVRPVRAQYLFNDRTFWEIPVDYDAVENTRGGVLSKPASPPNSQRDITHGSQKDMAHGSQKDLAKVTIQEETETETQMSEFS